MTIHTHLENPVARVTTVIELKNGQTVRIEAEEPWLSWEYRVPAFHFTDGLFPVGLPMRDAAFTEVRLRQEPWGKPIQLTFTETVAHEDAPAGLVVDQPLVP